MTKLKIILYTIIFLGALFVLSCNNAGEKIKGIDVQKWKNDPHGCLKYRLSVIDTLTNQKATFNGWSEYDLKTVFGKPFRIQLYVRNSKFYQYIIDPDSTCQANSKRPRLLYFRITPINTVNEVFVK